LIIVRSALGAELALLEEMLELEDELLLLDELEELAGQFTVVVTVADVLLELFGSVDDALTVATLLRELCVQLAMFGTLKTMLNVLESPDTRLKLLHSTLVCGPFNTHPGLFAASKFAAVSPAGITSPMTTLVAVAAPKFTAVTV
jgi:hypothetical protein